MALNVTMLHGAQSAAGAGGESCDDEDDDSIVHLRIGECFEGAPEATGELKGYFEPADPGYTGRDLRWVDSSLLLGRELRHWCNVKDVHLQADMLSLCFDMRRESDPSKRRYNVVGRMIRALLHKGAQPATVSYAMPEGSWDVGVASDAATLWHAFIRYGEVEFVHMALQLDMGLMHANIGGNQPTLIFALRLLASNDTKLVPDRARLLEVIDCLLEDFITYAYYASSRFIDVTLPDEIGRSALWWAAAAGYPRYVATLLARLPDNAAAFTAARNRAHECFLRPCADEVRERFAHVIRILEERLEKMHQAALTVRRAEEKAQAKRARRVEAIRSAEQARVAHEAKVAEEAATEKAATEKAATEKAATEKARREAAQREAAAKTAAAEARAPKVKSLHDKMRELRIARGGGR